RNAARRRGEMAVVVGDADNSEALLEDLVRLHTSAWKRGGKAGVFGDKRMKEFHAAALPGLMAPELAGLYALIMGGATVAAYYGVHDRGRAYAYLQGFDPDYASESPGTILVAHAIEQAIKDGAREFHFLRGDEAYKYQWGAAERRNQMRLFTREGSIAAG